MMTDGDFSLLFSIQFVYTVFKDFNFYRVALFLEVRRSETECTPHSMEKRHRFQC